MRQRFFRNVFAISIILLGIFLVFVNIGVLTWSLRDWWHYIYPSFFILLGVKWIYQAFKGLNGFGTPVFLVIFGSLLLLDQFTYLTFGFWDVYKLWPLILIFVGLRFLGWPRKHKKPFKFVYDSHSREEDDQKPKYSKFIVGEYSYDTPNWKVEPIQLWNAVGDYTLDFTKAFIPDQDTPITIHGLAGDIKIIIPDHVDFYVKASVKAGNISVLDNGSEGINRILSHSTPGYDEATRKLTFDLKLKAGSIRIDRI
ncbi:cell wall-active antibiotics response protein LiaF [Amphibacillus jilinensis]|uniref:cell wall-active antibiotics response protein LiaF n=1 Tax=Amphibacillus jilinensis TaxID=1216008 RepID=UPI0003145D05|nr:cell wall-active antibiotics response protein LiaF [Amphibacillus jilinensis]